MLDVPCNATAAVARAKRCVLPATPPYRDHNYYWLGTGDYAPFTPLCVDHTSAVSGNNVIDWPWTEDEDALAAGYRKCSDCAGFAICWCWRLHRHRPGFNHGNWASVSDDINVNSAMEDAVHHQELFEEVSPTVVRPGDLLCYPTFRLKGVKKPFIGHVGIVLDVAPAYLTGRYSKLLMAHCHGPNGREPAVTQNMATHFEQHDRDWPKPEHRTHIIRPKERK